jgi:hypothetical protein
MKQEWMAEAVLDVGSPSIGRKLNLIDDINCPEGHGLLDKSYDETQTHIWFETCPTCGGIFLDAGEFTDLKYHTLMDRVRGIVKGGRPS